MPTTSIPAVLSAIRYWIDSAKTAETKKTLFLHHLPGEFLPPLPDAYMENPEEGYKKAAVATLEDMSDEELVFLRVVPQYVPAHRARRYLETHKSELAEAIVDRLRGNSDAPAPEDDFEASLYKMTKTLPVATELQGRHPALKQLAEALKRKRVIPNILVAKVTPPGPLFTREGSPPWTGKTGDRNDMETKYTASRARFYTTSSTSA